MLIILSLFWKFRLREQTRVSKNFLGEYLFVFVKYLCNCCPKIRPKKITKLYFDFNYYRPVGRRNVFVSGAGGLRFQSRTGQIGHSVIYGLPLLQHFFEWSFVAMAQRLRMGPANSLHTGPQYSEYNERFDFNCCKLSELAGCFTPFKTKLKMCNRVLLYFQQLGRLVHK